MYGYLLTRSFWVSILQHSCSADKYLWMHRLRGSLMLEKFIEYYVWRCSMTSGGAWYCRYKGSWSTLFPWCQRGRMLLNVFLVMVAIKDNHIIGYKKDTRNILPTISPFGLDGNHDQKYIQQHSPPLTSRAKDRSISFVPTIPCSPEIMLHLQT